VPLQGTSWLLLWLQEWPTQLVLLRLAQMSLPQQRQRSHQFCLAQMPCLWTSQLPPEAWTAATLTQAFRAFLQMICHPRTSAQLQQWPTLLLQRSAQQV
jgi:hypothetical protein